MTPIPEGLSADVEFVPKRGDTAAAIGNEGVLAVSTPAILGFLEQTSLEAIRAYQPPDHVSVGAHVTLDHVGPAFPGAPVRCRAKVVAVEGRRITFEVEAAQADRVVARGRYLRVMLPASRFHAGAPPAATGDPIDFWFDVHSPWSYLAATRLPAVASRHGRPIRWIPVHVARLIETIGGRRPLDENPAFVRWYRQDLADAAEQAGLVVRYHPDFPLRPARALRAATCAIELGAGPAFVAALMRAYWTQSRDISDPAVLAALGESVGLPGLTVAAAASSDAYRDKVATATRHAIDAGVFGVPSFRADGKLFFGNDRIDLLDARLAKRDATGSS